MDKSIKELATEITVAYLNAVGEGFSGTTSGFHESWIKNNQIAAVYKNAYDIISECENKETE